MQERRNSPKMLQENTLLRLGNVLLIMEDSGRNLSLLCGRLNGVFHREILRKKIDEIRKKMEPLLVHLNPFSMNLGSVPVGAASSEEQLSVVLIPDMTQTWLHTQEQ